jgi:hypothetical protein
MPLVNPIILTATGSSFQITPLPAVGIAVPPVLTFTVATGGATVGATTIPVTIAGSSGITLASTTIANATYIFVGTGLSTNSQIVSVNGDQLATVTSLAVDPLTKALVAGDTFTAYAGTIPLLGLEGANWQAQKQVNSIVLFSSGGWETSAYGRGTSQFSGTLHIPTDPLLAKGQRAITDYLLAEKYVYVERFLPNGDYAAGAAVVTDVSDTTQGDSFININLTLKITGKPVYKRIG